MAIATYSDLKTAIQNWLARSDLSTTADDFIDLAEAYFDIELRDLKMQKVSTLATVSEQDYVNLPSDYLGMIKLRLQDNPRPLELVSLQFIDDKYLGSQNGRPQVYSFRPDAGTDRIVLAPVPDSVYTLDIIYYYGITALSGSNTTNWLMTRLPNLYLATSLYYAATYIKDFEAADRFFAEAQALLNTIKKTDRRDRQQQERLNSRVITNVV